MPCCKTSKYGWCSEYETVYMDKDKHEYCIFHSPKVKGVNSYNFQQKVYARIQNSIKHNTKCDLRGTIFPETTFFTKYNKENPFPNVDFSFAVFKMDSYFEGTSFSGKAIFNEVSFGWSTNFTKASFEGKVKFEKSEFNGNAQFTKADFGKDAHFSETIFIETASFDKADFREDAIFKKVDFRHGPRFSGTFFGGDTDFENAQFSGYTDFKEAIFSGESSFSHADFYSSADFNSVKFGANATFLKADFKSNTYFDEANFAGIAYFNHAVFNKKPSFGNVFFSRRANFIETEFTKGANFFQSSTADLIYFEDVNLSLVSFLNSNLINFDFIDCQWQKTAGRNILFDEIKIKVKNDQASFEKVEFLYRKLKQKYKGNNEPEASNWHYGEKEMFRKKRPGRRRNPISFSNLYWAFSGYGERPLRAGIVLIVFFVSVTFLMSVFGLKSVSGNEVFGIKEFHDFSWLVNWKKFWLINYNTLQNVLFFKDTYFKPQSLAGTIILTITAKIIIPIQAALFVLSLRNKFRR